MHSCINGLNSCTSHSDHVFSLSHSAFFSFTNNLVIYFVNVRIRKESLANDQRAKEKEKFMRKNQT